MPSGSGNSCSVAGGGQLIFGQTTVDVSEIIISIPKLLSRLDVASVVDQDPKYTVFGLFACESILSNSPCSKKDKKSEYIH